MRQLHTWAGVILGGLLFAIFWMGSLSVFDREIDSWMMPHTRIVWPDTTSLDRALETARRIAPFSSEFSFDLPSPRARFIRLHYQDETGKYIFRDVDPGSGVLLPDAGTLGGTGFIFPFHFGLHLNWLGIGSWLVGLAGMSMLISLVSGVIIHRRLIADFFTFRPKFKLLLSSLDLHHLSSVLALPFHFVITLSGLIIYFGTFFPTVVSTAYPDGPTVYNEETYGACTREATGKPVDSLVSLDAMAHRASQVWSGEQPAVVNVHHLNDANVHIAMFRSFATGVSILRGYVCFDGATGETLSEHTLAPVMSANSFITGIHFIQFEHWPLRWLYFVLGLTGCVMIATGLVFWLESRRKRHLQLNLLGFRLVEVIAIGSVTGIIAATLAFFIANRLLPNDSAYFGLGRAALEIWAFYIAWILAFAHAWLRSGRAWPEQCWAIATMAVVAVALNWATTGDYLYTTIADGLWPVAGMDLLLLVSALSAAIAARKLSRRESVVAKAAVTETGDTRGNTSV